MALEAKVQHSPMDEDLTKMLGTSAGIVYVASSYILSVARQARPTVANLARKG